MAAHPHAPYPSGVFMFPFRGFDVVEVRNGLWASDRSWNADNEAAPWRSGGEPRGRHRHRHVAARNGQENDSRLMVDRWQCGQQYEVCRWGPSAFTPTEERSTRRPLPADGTGMVRWDTTEEHSAFVRIEVRHPNGDVAALTNPIILN